MPWLILSFMVGGGIALITQVWWESISPNPIVIKHVDIRTLRDNGYELSVYTFVPIAPACLRFTQHILYQDRTDGRAYIPLGSGMSGSGFFRRSDAREDAITLLKVHPGQVDEGGVWQYVMRVTYQCSAFPGLTRFTEWESRPVTVRFNSSGASVKQGANHVDPLDRAIDSAFGGLRLGLPGRILRRDSGLG